MRRTTERLRAQARQPRGWTMSCEPTLLMRWVLRLWPGFQALHPALHFRLLAGGGAQSLDDAGIDLAVRREQLRLRSAQLREQIAVRTAVFRPVFHATDRVRGGVRSVQSARKSHALALLAGSAVVGAMLVRPRAAMNLGLRVWSGWQMFRRVQPLVNRVLRQLG